MNRPPVFAFVACLAMTATAAPSSPAPLTADLLVVNATVRTMDTNHPTAHAVAIRGNRILTVGSDAEVRPLSGHSTRIIDAHGQLVLPGFNDAHVHFLSGGFQPRFP